MSEQDYSLESLRMQSFEKWPKLNAFPTPSLFASSGFYYTGMADEVQCFSCHFKWKNWTEQMIPSNIHMEHRPQCHLVMGLEDKNKPLLTTPHQSINIINTELPESRLEMSTLPTTIFKKPLDVNPLGFSAPPIYSSDMRIEASRLATYQSWPKPLDVSPHNLAKAGLYFTGPQDRVECAFCHGKLEGWRLGDNADFEHRKHFGRKCDFAKKLNVGNVPMNAIIGESANGAEDIKPSSAFIKPLNCYSQLPIDNNAKRDILETAQSESDNLESIVKQLIQSKTCKICLTNEINVVLIPCGHLICCNLCVTPLKKCPICRLKIEKVVKTFLA